MDNLNRRLTRTAHPKSDSLLPPVLSGITKLFEGLGLRSPGLNGPERRSPVADGIAKLPEDFADLLMELRATRENSIRVHSALGKFGAPLSAHNVSPQHFATEGDAYRFGIAPLKVEVLTKISGVSFDDALNDSQTFDLNGQAVPYIGRAALIRNKQSAGRHKDLADVEELERLAT